MREKLGGEITFDPGHLKWKKSQSLEYLFWAYSMHGEDVNEPAWGALVL